MVATDGAIWIAGSSLYRSADGQWESVIDDGRFNSLAYRGSAEQLWFADSEGIGYLSIRDGEVRRVEAGVPGYVWNVWYWKDRIWYVASTVIGWIDPDSATVGEHWEIDLSPRPFLIVPGGEENRVFVGSLHGLWELELDGLTKVVLPEDVDARIVSWAIASSQGGYYLGTNRAVYRWSGDGADSPRKIRSDYERYFGRGINNAVAYGRQVAIVDHPDGVVIWDAGRESVAGYVGRSSGLDVGIVQKVAQGPDDVVFVMGTEGCAVVRMDDRRRFFPKDEMLSDEPPREAFFHGGDGIVFGENNWFRFNERGVERRRLEHAVSWAGVDSTNSIVYGALHRFLRWDEGEWRISELGTPARSVLFTLDGGFATGPNGLHTVSGKPDLELVYPLRTDYQLVGAFDSSVIGMDHENRLTRFVFRGAAWEQERMGVELSGRFLSSASLPQSLFLVFESGLYQVRKDRAEQVPLGSGWSARGLAAHGSAAYGLLHHESVGVALSRWGNDGSVAMVRVDDLDRIGEPLALMVGEEMIGFVGSDGVLLESRDNLTTVSVPQVRARITYEGELAEARRFPYGARRIALETATGSPGVPVQIAYRLNEGDWQTVSPGVLPLQVGGHGRFRVEVRPVFPNGIAGEVRNLEFAIAPPWYLNPFAHGGMVVLVIGLTWLIFYLRHINVQRTNRRLRDEVKRQTRELEAATAARTNFLAGISHDIRNPLNGILLISESLSSDPPATPADPRLDDIRDLGMVVDQMLGEVLDFSVIDRSSIALVPVPVRVADIIQSAIQQNQWAIERSLINVTTRIPEEVHALSIEADRSWLIQVLSNLIVNAVDYSQTERIEVGAILRHSGVTTVVLELFVKDWGVGIPDSEKSMVFERFYRGETGVESGRHGTGLGLAICNDAIRAMGGELLVSDNEPGGTAFTITCRFEKADGDQEIDRNGILETLRGKSVLVVEDLEYNRNAMVRFFQRWGCIVESCGHGGEALELLKSRSYYLAMLDWDLPGLTGPQISRRFGREKPGSDVILIALTAYTDAEKKRESRDSGMHGYLAKPLTAQRLAYTLASIQGHWKQAPRESARDHVDSGRIESAIEEKVEALVRSGEQSDLEGVRRVAHQLTTLALMAGNRQLQRMCRDLQEFAEGGDVDRVQQILLDVRKWNKN